MPSNAGPICQLCLARSKIMQTSGLQLWFGAWKVTGSGADPAQIMSDY